MPLRVEDITSTREKYIFTDTAIHTGDWHGLFALSDITITTLTDDKLKAGSWNGRTFRQGTYLSGEFSSIQLASGEVCMYE